MLNIADAYAHTPELFSLEMWGGATFDTSMRFLKECPWERLAELRERIPNILFQMLLRASNAVGYTNYPDNVVQEFVKEAAARRDRRLPHLRRAQLGAEHAVAMDAVLKTGAICEAAICYTGDILEPERTKYDLKYYVEWPRSWKRWARTSWRSRTWPACASRTPPKLLVKAQAGDRHADPLPHARHGGHSGGVDPEGGRGGLDIADAAMAPMSGGTSQPNLNTLVEALRFTKRDTGLNSTEPLTRIADYWRGGARVLRARSRARCCRHGRPVQHEMPGGQYTNLYQQARALGWPTAGTRSADVCRGEPAVRRHRQGHADLEGVGDMALFMVANNLTAEDVLDPRSASWPSPSRSST
jgi:pyruvate carboxylase